MRTFQKSYVDVIYFGFGYLICGSGGALLVYSNLGADSFNVCAQGIAKHIELQVGTAGLILQLVFLAYIFWTDKRKIGLGTVLGSMIIAATINAWAPVLQPLLASAPLMIRMVCVIVEPLLVGPALAMIQVSGMGLGPTDTVPVVLCAQLKRFSFRTIRVGYDCLLLLLGALLGGVVGPGTVMPALRIGPSIQFSLPYVIRFSKRYKKDQCI